MCGDPIRLGGLFHELQQLLVADLFPGRRKHGLKTSHPQMSDCLGQHSALHLAHDCPGIRAPEELKSEEGPEDLPVITGQRLGTFHDLPDYCRCINFKIGQLLFKNIVSIRMARQRIEIRLDRRIFRRQDKALPVTETDYAYLRLAVIGGIAFQIEVRNCVVPLADFPNAYCVLSFQGLPLDAYCPSPEGSDCPQRRRGRVFS